MAKSRLKPQVDTNGTQLFTVPNNAAGHAFLALMREFVQRPMRIVIRGRAANRKKAWKGHKFDGKHARQTRVPFKKADWYAVYFYMADPNGGWDINISHLLKTLRAMKKKLPPTPVVERS